MAESALPLSLVQEIRELKRRVNALERSRSTRTVQNQTFTILDSTDATRLTLDEDGLILLDGNGDPYLTLGVVAGGYGAVAQLSGSSSATWWVDADEGLRSPYLQAPWEKANETVTVTSGSFVSTWAATVELVVARCMAFNVYAICDAGTTGEMYLYHADGDSETLALTDGSSALYRCEFAHSADLATGPHNFQLRARRVSGGGNVYMYTPTGLGQTGLVGGTPHWVTV